jgi:hypothetical protein
MNRTVSGVMVTIGSLFLASTAIRAHHSFSAAFDATRPVEVTGVVTAVRIENPHAWFYVDVTDAKGQVTNWGFEGNTPTSLVRAGYKRDSVKVGDKVTVKGVRARDLSAPRGAVREIILSDGRSFIVGPGRPEEVQ